MSGYYSGLDAISGAKVVSATGHEIIFDNGWRIVCEDIENYIEIPKEDE